MSTTRTATLNLKSLITDGADLRISRILDYTISEIRGFELLVQLSLQFNRKKLIRDGSIQPCDAGLMHGDVSHP